MPVIAGERRPNGFDVIHVAPVSVSSTVSAQVRSVAPSLHRLAEYQRPLAADA